MLDSENRTLPFEAIHNFRDYGGYRTRSGAAILRGHLFRSGHISHASPSDISQLSTIDLGVIIDLRSDSERKTHPAPSAMVPRPQMAFVADPDGDTPHLSSRFQGMRHRSEAMAAMTAIYSDLPFNPTNQQSFALHLRCLAQCQTPSLVHCFAGKDRTGISVALFHHVMGVLEDEIFADYLLTNTSGDERMAAGIEALRTKYQLDVSDEVLEEVMLVRPEYLATAFSLMVSRYGSIDNYVAKGLAVSDVEIARLKRQYSD